jgi:hypothetical protein
LISWPEKNAQRHKEALDIQNGAKLAIDGSFAVALAQLGDFPLDQPPCERRQLAAVGRRCSKCS